MASETILANASTLGKNQSSTQVRIQLSTRHPDISLPEVPGPILVNTSNVMLKLHIQKHHLM